MNIEITEKRFKEAADKHIRLFSLTYGTFHHKNRLSRTIEFAKTMARGIIFPDEKRKYISYLTDRCLEHQEKKQYESEPLTAN